MRKDEHFVDGFYCKECGSTTAVVVGNLSLVRCMGCLRLYERGPVWQPVDMKEMEAIREGPPPGPHGADTGRPTGVGPI
ncbi:hypothetical protein ES708_23794 [subsurface metagenome]